MPDLDISRSIPSPLVIMVFINNQAVRALLDTGSLADFMSTTLADQLSLAREPLEKPLPVQLAISGSRTVVNYSATVDLRYQDINERRRFDIVNLDSYDLILGTPFLFAHKVLLGFNPSQIAIGSKISLPIKGESVSVISSRAADVLDTRLDVLRQELKNYAKNICKDALQTPLPPLRAVELELLLRREPIT
ncbi:hypothetical protein BD410DRAFT_816934 [Rickenella mellea]|uniref:Peptidase A2 domain-containing protein n=1 Tax=Rickenella mellea TaxID=50990 RepID=A0A4Y7PKP4_9AGAM|nr:hypothetical protein BD410DRAFT_816934 [Rickenella mellea]